MKARPFYTEYAWAFDLLIDRPVRRECGTIVAWLVGRGVLPGSALLDAGCGTGRYATELARRGYLVHGVDSSPELIDVARRASEAQTSVTFEVANILERPPGRSRYDAVLCRGVLNDLVDDADRSAVFAAFASALRPGGALILDVREWEASAARKSRELLFRKRVSTDRGELTFTSVTTLDPKNHRLMISERHTLVEQGAERISDYEFVMRCWERAELSSQLERNGFGDVRYFGAFDAGVEVGATDRLVAVAQRSAPTA